MNVKQEIIRDAIQYLPQNPTAADCEKALITCFQKRKDFYNEFMNNDDCQKAFINKIKKFI